MLCDMMGLWYRIDFNVFNGVLMSFFRNSMKFLTNKC